MAGRALAFSDAEIVRLAREEFVPVAMDDWYQRRRQDAEGRFFLGVADQGPRRGNGTRQGIYCFTAAGKLLVYKNAGQDPDVMREVFTEGLRKWRALPETERRAGAVEVGEHGPLDARYARPLPTDGATVRVFTRLLGRAGGAYVEAQSEPGKGNESARDHLWILPAEWRALLRPGMKAGDVFPVPADLAARIAQYHLVDNTRGEPPFWTREQVREQEMAVKVLEVAGSRVRLQFTGRVLASTGAEAGGNARGFDARLLGNVEVDSARPSLERFDLVAVGEHWGNGPHTGGERAGRTPMGVAFELADGKAPGDRVAPQGARDWRDYIGK